MPIDSLLIPDPVLDARTEAERIAARIHRSIGNLTVLDAELGIEFYTVLKAILESSGAVSAPLLPELTSARAAEAHVVLLTELERMVTEAIFRLNQVPNKVHVNQLRLIGTELLVAAAATTTLQFTKLDDFVPQEVVIPAGTEVATADRKIRVATTDDLTIPAAMASGTVSARAAVEGDIGNPPPGSVGLLLSALPGIATVVNTTYLTGGRNAETPEQGKIRAREEFSIGRHLGSNSDWEKRIYFDVLGGKGRITAFEGYLGDFSRPEKPLGYLLLVIQGADGLSPTAETLGEVGTLINERHIAGIQVTERSPAYKSFNVEANVIITNSGSSALVDKAKANLVEFYNPMTFPYGPKFTTRALEVSDIIGQIEKAGPQNISVKRTNGVPDITITTGNQSYKDDVPLTIGELPLLGMATLNVVN